ncbi:MAG: Sb-PDE family phosphodiesterase [Flavobacteriia bacterium]|nr:Sb-PDE family phosphodiesterase [Flavobacteriia bacterium]
MKKTLLILVFALTATIGISAQEHSHAGAKAIAYPDIPGYKSLSTDLHIHSVFSDGNVWPSIRVQEALRENLDAISLTEHLEYQPHAKDLPHPDRNRAYELALQEAKDHDLLIVPGSEITRAAPVGHNNAVFITDANPMLGKEPQHPFDAAKSQGAFVFWNHPAWYVQQPKGNPVLSDFQKKQIKEGKLHGIEVINTGDYAEESLAIALEYNLAIMGTSDVHDLIDWDYIQKGVHRPITLVFAKEKSIESLKEGLFARRTVAIFNDLWVGKSEFIGPLLEASVSASDVHYMGDSQVLSVTLHNHSSSNLLFENQMPYNFYHHPPIVEIPAQGSLTLQIKTLERKSEITLKLKALKAYTAPKTQAVVQWNIQVSDSKN